MLSEMSDFAQQSESAASEWADGRETAFTEELDSNLRAHRCGQYTACINGGGIAQGYPFMSPTHVSVPDALDLPIFPIRPRAGRIEEETRLGRSVELVAQRRRAENHLRAQSQAVRSQADQFGDWMKGLRDQAHR